MTHDKRRYLRGLLRRNYAVTYAARRALAVTEHPRAWELAIGSLMAARQLIRQRMCA